MSDQAAAQLIANPVTAWVMLEEELNLKPGDWVLQTAAGSTLGRLVIQLARLRGYRTINLVRRREQVDDLLASGADAVCHRRRRRRGTHQTGDRRTRRIGALDAVGGEMGGRRCGGCARRHDAHLWHVERPPLPLHNGEMLFRGLTARGFWPTTGSSKHPGPGRRDIGSAVATDGRRRTRAASGSEYDLAEFPAPWPTPNGRAGKGRSC